MSARDDAYARHQQARKRVSGGVQDFDAVKPVKSRRAEGGAKFNKSGA